MILFGGDFMKKGIVFNIQKFSVHDGPGIRTTIFFKGCNLRCAWCHNPESQYSNLQVLFYKNKCTECGKCRSICPNELKNCDFCGKCVSSCFNGARELCGKEYDSGTLFAEIIKDRAYYEQSGGGVTFSGGECMLQDEFLLALLKKCKESSIHTAIDTAGHIPWAIFEKVLPYTDLFLYDIKSMNSTTHRQYTGVDNELILKNLSNLLHMEKKVWVRIPIIPNVNDSPKEMQMIRDFFEEHGFPEKCELLPYHALGENKYAALNRKVCSFSIPDDDTIKKLFEIIHTK